MAAPSAAAAAAVFVLVVYGVRCTLPPPPSSLVFRHFRARVEIFLQLCIIARLCRKLLLQRCRGYDEIG